MKIKGASYLNRNNYNSISIVGDNVSNIKCNVSGEKNNNKFIQSSSSLLEDLSNPLTTLEILNYYLDYNNIVNVVKGNYRTYENPGLIINSRQNKKFFLSVPSDIENSDEMIRRIINNFYNSVYKEFFNPKYKIISINVNRNEFNISQGLSEDLKLSIQSVKAIDLIGKRLENSNKISPVDKFFNIYHIRGKEIECGRIYVSIDDTDILIEGLTHEEVEIFYDLIDNHNDNITVEYQLKLKGTTYENNWEC